MKPSLGDMLEDWILYHPAQAFVVGMCVVIVFATLVSVLSY